MKKIAPRGDQTDSLANTMPPKNRQSDLTASIGDRVATEAVDMTQTNPLGDTINEAANTEFQPDQTENSPK